MVLYRLAGLGDEELKSQQQSATVSLAPPPPIATPGGIRTPRASVYSSNGSIFSEVSDSKYPSRYPDDSPGTPPPSTGAFLPYEYDPTDDLEKPDDAEDELHTPDPVGTKERISIFNMRAFVNILVILLLLLGLIILFLAYPILSQKYLQIQSNWLSASDEGTDKKSAS
jgi:hypothetical protein